MNRTKIEWTDYTWNMWSGCQPVSEGCKYCYAKRIASRGGRAFPNGFGLTMRPHKLRNIVGFAPGDKAFVNSMSDFFLEEVEDEHRDDIIEAILKRPDVTFQILTKRPKAMLDYIHARTPLPANIWLGVTVESQAQVHRIDDLLLAGHQGLLFISCEPLLGPVDLGPLDGISWLIVGGESGNHLMDPDIRAKRGLVTRVDHTKDADGKLVKAHWKPTERGTQIVQDLRRQAMDHGVAFFFKQWGGYLPNAAGCILDHSVYKEFPDQEVNR